MESCRSPFQCDAQGLVKTWWLWTSLVWHMSLELQGPVHQEKTGKVLTWLDLLLCTEKSVLLPSFAISLSTVIHSRTHLWDTHFWHTTFSEMHWDGNACNYHIIHGTRTILQHRMWMWCLFCFPFICNSHCSHSRFPFPFIAQGTYRLLEWSGVLIHKIWCKLLIL